MIYCKKNNSTRRLYPSSIGNETTTFIRGSKLRGSMVSNISFKILEVIPSHSLHRINQGTTVSLNTQVRPPGKSLSLPVNGSKVDFSCSKLFSIKKIQRDVHLSIYYYHNSHSRSRLTLSDIHHIH